MVCQTRLAEHMPLAPASRRRGRLVLQDSRDHHSRAAHQLELVAYQDRLLWAWRCEDSGQHRTRRLCTLCWGRRRDHGRRAAGCESMRLRSERGHAHRAMPTLLQRTVQKVPLRLVQVRAELCRALSSPANSLTDQSPSCLSSGAARATFVRRAQTPSPRQQRRRRRLRRLRRPISRRIHHWQL